MIVRRPRAAVRAACSASWRSRASSGTGRSRRACSSSRTASGSMLAKLGASVLIGLALGLRGDRARSSRSSGVIRRRARLRHDRPARSSRDRRRDGGHRRCTPRSASASARSCATRSARSSARSSTCSCSRTCSQIIPGQLDDIMPSTASAALSNALFGADTGRRATCSARCPAGLLLALYAAIFLVDRDPADAAAGHHRVMHLRPATPQDAEARGGPRDRGRHRRDGGARLHARATCTTSGRSRTSTWPRTPWSSRTSRRDRRLRPLPRRRRAGVGRPAPRGRGRGHRAARVGRAARARARRDTGAPGHRRSRRHAPARCSRRTATRAVRSYWRMARARRARRPRTTTGLRPLARRGRHRAVRDHEARLRRPTPTTSPSAEETWTQPRVRRPRPRPRALAARRDGQGFALVRRWRGRRRLRRRCSPSTPTTRARASARALLQAVFAGAERPGYARPLNVASDNPNARRASTSASG